MNRITEMNAFLAEKTEALLHNQEESFANGFKPQKSDLYRILEDMKKRIKNEDDEAIVISYLRSSYITGSHKFRVAIYSKSQIFVEEYPEHSYIEMGFLFVREKEIMQELITELKKGFIRIVKKEIEEIRRCFFDRLYESCQVFFEDLVKQSVAESGKVTIYYGAEMGEMISIGLI